MLQAAHLLADNRGTPTVPPLPVFVAQDRRRTGWYQHAWIERLRSGVFGVEIAPGHNPCPHQSPGALEPQLTRLLAGLEPNLTMVIVRTMRQQVALRFDQERAVAALAGLFIGLLLGVPLSSGAGRLIASELYGVASWDPASLALAASALAVCAFTAGLIPAHRAASISPVDALKVE